MFDTFYKQKNLTVNFSVKLYLNLIIINVIFKRFQL